jgi:hypothetical protein
MIERALRVVRSGEPALAPEPGEPPMSGLPNLGGVFEDTAHPHGMLVFKAVDGDGNIVDWRAVHVAVYRDSVIEELHDSLDRWNAERARVTSLSG